MNITQKGQVTIPLAIRKEFGLLPHTKIEFVVRNNQVVIKPCKPKASEKSPLKKLVGTATIPLTTDQIMALTRG